MTVGFLGAGHMGGAMLRGLAAADFRPALRVFDAAPGRSEALAAELGAVAASSPADLAAGCNAVVLAVRPGDLPALLAELKGTAPLYLSIAAGRRIAWIEGRLPAGARVVRAMPNLGVSVGLGMTAYAPGSRATPDDLALAGRILSSFGRAVQLPEENLDAVTALSGSGPAFLAYALQAMADGGAALGLAPDAAALLALHRRRQGRPRRLRRARRLRGDPRRRRAPRRGARRAVDAARRGVLESAAFPGDARANQPRKTP